MGKERIEDTLKEADSEDKEDDWKKKRMLHLKQINELEY